LPLDHVRREDLASGVMMLPIPEEGILEDVRGQDEARAIPHIAGLEISIARGKAVTPLPEGDRYLGFIFAKAETPEEVERALREAHSRLVVGVS
jgi:L-amino acid ligase C-terminal domain 2